MASKCNLPQHISIGIIKHVHQRYDTAGDYQALSKHCWRIAVTRMPDWRHSALVLVHELVEMILTRHHGVSWKAVDKWDFAHPDSDDPGRLPGCPYGKEHLAAERIEKILALLLGVKWSDYQAAFNKLKWRKSK